MTVELDKSGRVALGKLPEGDLEKVALGKEVVVVGDADHFCVYSTEKWSELEAEVEDDLDALLDAMD